MHFLQSPPFGSTYKKLYMVQHTTRPTATFSGRIRPPERMFPGVPGEMMECRWLAPVKKE